MAANSNDRLVVEMSEMLAGAQTVVGALADARKQRESLTASVSVERGRITVVVDATGAIIETRFSDEVGDLSYSAIARATVQAAQQAAAEVAAKSEELTAPVRELQSKLPRLPDMVAGLQNMVGGLQDPRGEIPPPPKPSLLSPAMREKETAGLEFEDVVDYEPGRSGVRDR